MNKEVAQILAFAGSMGALPDLSNYRAALGAEKRDRSPELVAELKSAAEEKRARKAAKRLAEK